MARPWSRQPPVLLSAKPRRRSLRTIPICRWTLWNPRRLIEAARIRGAAPCRSHFCHPNTPHRKLQLPEWYISTLMMDRALDAVVRRVKSLDRKHDIPYLAGYSRDGKTIYIDRHMPPNDPLRRPRDRHRPLSHPARGGGEDADRSARPALPARPSDRHARRAGGGARRRHPLARLRPLHAGATSRTIGDERLTKVPADLDLKPYRDEHDYDLVQRMLDCIARNQAPPGVTAERIQPAVQRYLPRLATSRRPGSERTAGKRPGSRTNCGAGYSEGCAFHVG